MLAGPPDANAWFARGNALWREGARDAAVAAYQSAVALRPDHSDARNNLGNALIELGRGAEAVPQYRAALAMRPKHAPTLYNLGNALLSAAEYGEAAEQFQAALALDPNHAGAHNNLGNALRALGRPGEAAENYRQASLLRPDFAGTHNNLGAALLALHRPAEAAAALREAVRLQPDYAEAWNNLGGALLAQDVPDAAVEAFRRATALDDSQVQARFGESLALLCQGRFKEGWAAYESRWLDPRFREDVRDYPVPLWLNQPGQDVAGKTVLLHAEQGLGDTLQFVRYAPMLRALGARVVLEAQTPLLPLLHGLVDATIAEGAALPPCDWHCPLLSLPHAFGTEIVTIPADVPYLAAPAPQLAAWAQALGPRLRRRIGLAFSGSPDHPDDALRSIPADLLRPLLALPQFEFHVVQKDVRPTDAEALRGVPNYSSAQTDFAETAGLLAQLDLIVSVDTSVAHLAGAMGLPVWLLLQHAADFRWLRGRADSPWYPSVQLFRQADDARWEPVLAQVVEALQG